ncbi:MAG TPA: hypothetical protein VHG35_06515 [Gemmatimonadales bacterium]|nr:hypothetical protein [Gemmatimonadales bacterium]
MNLALQTLLIGAVAVAGIAFTTLAETMEEHTIFSPEEIDWGPASIPPGA